MRGLGERLGRAWAAQPHGRRVLLVRNGQSTANEGGLLCGWTDPRLTPLGRRQAHELFRELRGLLPQLDGVFCSDLRRSTQFAEIATGFGAAGHARPDSRLREINFGEEEGLCYDALPAAEQRRVDSPDYRAPGGEGWAEVRERMLGFLQDLPAGRHLVFGHGGAICAVTHGRGIDDVVPNAACVLLDTALNATLLQAFSAAELRAQLAAEP